MTTADQVSIEERLTELVRREGLYSSYERLRFRMAQVYQHIPLRGRRLLEIGAGTGAFSLYSAATGAQQVVALEPDSHGATDGSLDRFRRSAEELGLDNIQLQSITLQEFDAGPDTFDIILLFNSINHLDEEACETLLERESSRAVYAAHFAKLHGMLSDGGHLIIADCMRQNLFRWIPLIRNPIMPTVNWDIHHQPGTWARLARDAGFGEIQVSYRIPYAARSVPALLDNPVVSFLTMSHFTLRCCKRAAGARHGDRTRSNP